MQNLAENVSEILTPSRFHTARVDSRVMERDRIILGGGNRSSKIIAPPAVLETLPNVEVIEGLAVDID